MTNSIFVPQNSAWTIVGKKKIASQHWWFCWNFKGMKLTWEVNSHSLQITQEEGILWTTATKRYLWGETTQFTGFYHCFVKKSYRNREQVTTGVVPSDTLMPAREWHECTTQNLEPKRRHLFGKQWHLQMVTFSVALWAFDHMPAALSSLLLHGESRPRQSKVS